jgi:lipopolysaccharide biosynthesis glycosyltransferase
MSGAADTAVVMACDAGYAPYAFALAEQIARTEPGRSFDICIFSAEALTLPQSLLPLGLRLETITGPNPYAGPNQSRHGSATYLRLLVPAQVAGRYRRVLYLDSDVWHQGGGIGGLLAVDMHGSPLAAVRDNTQWRTPARRLPEFRALGRPAKPYFNGGVLLIDVQRWLDQDIAGRCLGLWQHHAAQMTRHDQSILNLVMDGSWTELSPLWNWQYTWSSRFFADLVEPRLVHFIGRRKPWKDTSNALPPRFRRSYVDFAARHGLEAPPVDGAAAGWPGNLGRAYIKHWWSLRSMRRYLDRFPDPLTTRACAGG